MKRYKSIFIFIFLLNLNMVFSQGVVKKAGGTSNDEGKSIATDGSGNSLVTGYFQGTATFGAGEINETVLTSSGEYDIFVAKYDLSGALLWAKKAGGTSDDRGYGIATDGSGNSFVTGWFEGTATLGASEINETVLTSSGEYDIFVAKYDPNGALLWAKHVGGTLHDFGYGIATDGSGNSLVTGYFSETATFGPGETNETDLISFGNGDLFVAKYDPSGVFLWAKQAGSTESDGGQSIATDGSGNILVTGIYAETATFGAGESNETFLAIIGHLDIFVAKYDPNGALLWVKNAGGTSSDVGYGIATDGSGNSLVTGISSETATFGAGESNETVLVSSGLADIFVAKYDPNGALLWAKKAGGTEFDYGRGIATDGSGNSLVTGWIKVSATFGAGEANETTLISSSAYYYDIFVAKYDPSGALLWAKKAGGTTSDVGNGIATDGSDNSLVTGGFSGAATFNQGETNQTVLTSSGIADIFIAKYDSNGAFTPEMNLKQSTINIADGGSYDYGSKTMGTNTDIVFTIENTGSTYLNLTTTLTLGGTDASQFNIQANPTSPVSVEGNTTFTVRFSPTSIGNKSATIIITNDDSDESLYDLTLVGMANPISVNISGYVKDSGGTPIDGANVAFSNGGPTVTTNTSGFYTADVDHGWSGTSTPTKTGLNFTPTNYSYASVNGDLTDIDYVATTSVQYIKISGYIKDGGNTAIEGVEIAFSNSGLTATTNAIGHYERTITKGWTGTSTASKEGWIFTPTHYDYAGASTNLPDQDYIGEKDNVTISGYIKDGTNLALGGVEIAFSNGGNTVTTDLTGYYQTIVINGWSGTSTPGKTDYTFEPSSITYSGISTNIPNQDYEGTDLTLAVNDYLNSLPTEFTVLPAYPNPFNPSTTIRYGLDTDSHAIVQIYDISGKLITTLQNEYQIQGWHSVVWNGTNQHREQAPAGLYLSRIVAGNEVKTSKLMLLK